MDDVLLRALRLRPEERFDDPTSFATALRGAVVGLPHQTRRSPRHQVAGVHLAVWLLALAVLLAGFLLGFRVLG